MAVLIIVIVPVLSILNLIKTDKVKDELTDMKLSMIQLKDQIINLTDSLVTKNDLNEIKDIPDNLPTVKTNSISITDEVILSPPKVEERKLSFYETPLFLWSVIMYSWSVPYFICVKMISEIKKKQ